MISPDLILLASYFLVLGVLALYGWHRYYLLCLCRAHRARGPAEDLPWRVHPRVTIQWPVFNETCGVARLIDAVCGQDYPRDRFEIQVLDESTDETRDLFHVGCLHARVRSLVQRCSPGVPVLAPQVDGVPREVQRPVPVREPVS